LIVCFFTAHCNERCAGDLNAIRNYYSGVDKVRTLQKGAFLAYNRDSGAELASRVF
jgi:hypothetical protein